MEKQALFIGAASSFLINAVKDGLKESGFATTFCKLKVDEISKIQDKPQFILIYVDDDSPHQNDALIYLRDIALEDDKQIFLIGYPDEVNEVKNKFPSNLIGGTFERPINVKEIAETLNASANNAILDTRKKHILLVDDSGTMLRTIKGWLESKYRISMANSATAAISFLAMNKPDLVLLDYEMPICSGPQMLQMIRSELKTESLPVIFLTAKGDKESVAQVLSLKPQGYLLKSMPPNSIIEAIDNFFLSQKSKEI